MRAGRYRQRITLARAPQTNVTGLAVREDWVRYASRIPGEVLPMSGLSSGWGLTRMSQVFEAQIVAVATHTVAIRYRPDTRLSDVVIWHDPDRGDRWLVIQGLIDPTSRRRELVLATSEDLGPQMTG